MLLMHSVIARSRTDQQVVRLVFRSPPAALVFAVFVCSGLSALIYQMVWQRSLLMIFGSNVESVAMVVAAFLMGLGIGSMAGGWLSQRAGVPLVLCFGAAELIIGAYGLISMPLFAWAGELADTIPQFMVGVLAFALVFLPTLLMGSTLPLLVADRVRADGEVGAAVSSLYFVNTLGAAIGAAFAVLWVLPVCGMRGAVQLAAGLNAVAAITVITASLWPQRGVHS
jgi:spermidine synthase